MFVVEGDLDVIFIRAVDDMVVRQDVPVGTDDHAGTGCLLRFAFRKLEIWTEEVEKVRSIHRRLPLPLVVTVMLTTVGVTALLTSTNALAEPFGIKVRMFDLAASPSFTCGSPANPGSQSTLKLDTSTTRTRCR